LEPEVMQNLLFVSPPHASTDGPSEGISIEQDRRLEFAGKMFVLAGVI